MARKKTSQEVIEEFIKIHGSKYNYNKVEYKGCNKDIIITCPKHGDFPQTPNSHKNGCGCPYCAKERVSEVLRKNGKTKAYSLEEFIDKAKEKHGNRYTYNKVEYVNNYTPIIITCPEHGDFPQKPYKHLQGQGCPWCAGNKKKTTEEFIEEARAVHGDRYDYSLVKYVNNITPVDIVCRIHGAFPQAPHAHKSGQGCPKCNQSHLEGQVRIFLEQNNVAFEPQKKFSWLVSDKNYPMFLDFYLTEYNIAVECQGIQHYLAEGNGYFTTKEVRATQQRDSMKYNLCKEYGVPVYYIKYNDNIEKRLVEIFNNIKKS